MSGLADQITSTVRGLTSRARASAAVAQDEARNAAFHSVMGTVQEARDAGVSEKTILACLKAVERSGRRP